MDKFNHNIDDLLSECLKDSDDYWWQERRYTDDEIALIVKMLFSSERDMYRSYLVSDRSIVEVKCYGY